MIIWSGWPGNESTVSAYTPPKIKIIKLDNFNKEHHSVYSHIPKGINGYIARRDTSKARPNLM